MGRTILLLPLCASYDTLWGDLYLYNKTKLETLPNKMVQMATLLICNQDALGSISGWNDWGISWFPSVSPNKWRTQPLPSSYFSFIKRERHTDTCLYKRFIKKRNILPCRRASSRFAGGGDVKGQKREREHICWTNSNTVMFTVFRGVTPGSLEQCEISSFRREAITQRVVLITYRHFGITYRSLLQGSRILGSSPLKELPLNGE